MSLNERRAAARRRAWGRGPMILRFEPLEGRQLMAARPQGRPDLIATAFDTVHSLDWGDSFHAVGNIGNQGTATTTSPFKVDVYASPGPVITRAAVLLGSVQFPAGLAPGASIQFDQVFNLPSIPMASTFSTNAVFIDLRVNPDRSVVESNYANDQTQGQGFDESVIAIAPHQSANLVGTTLGITPSSLTWGDTINLTTQIMDNGPGNAPATRARVMLTPAGITPGGSSDVTIDSFAVPAIGAYQTANVVRSITLPASTPSLLAGVSQYTITVVPDADFLTNAAISHHSAQGLGLDQAQLTILPGPNTPATKGPLPDLAAGGVQVPTTTAAWGQSFPATATVQNVGQADAGPVRVRFLLAGVNGTVGGSIFLADALLSGIKAGTSQEVTQMITIPGRLPYGFVLNGTGPARILVVLDPENTVDEGLKTNNIAGSGPIALRLVGSDGTTNVPTVPTATSVKNPAPAGTLAPGTTIPIKKPTTHTKTTLKSVTKKVGDWFKSIGKKLSIGGSSGTK